MNPANAWLLLTTRSTGVNLMPGGFGALKPSDIAHALAGLPRDRFLLGMSILAGDLSNLSELRMLVWWNVVLPRAEEGGWSIRRGSRIYRRLAELAIYEALQGARCIHCNGKGTYGDAGAFSGQGAQPSAAGLSQVLSRLRRLELRAELLRREIKSGAGKRHESLILVRRLKRILRWIDGYVRMTCILPGPRACEVCSGSGVHEIDQLQRAWLTGMSREHWSRVWSCRYDPIRYELDAWKDECLWHVRRRLVGRAA